MIFVEIAASRIDVELVLVGLGHHHHHGMRQRSPTEVQQLDDLVEGRRVAPAGSDDRENRCEVTEDGGFQLGLSRAHPVSVALDGVDLAIVGDHAERLGERPGRECVGGITRVHEGEFRSKTLVREVGVEGLELKRCHHALVNDGATAQRREVHGELALGALAQPECLPIKGDTLRRLTRCIRCLRTQGAGKEDLFEEWHRFAGEVAENLRVHRHLAPAEHSEVLLRSEGGEPLFGCGTFAGVDRQKGRASDVLASGRQGDTGDRPEEDIWDLSDDARAIPRARIRPDGATVLEVAQRIESEVDDVVPGSATKGRNHCEAAGVFLATRVIESGCSGRGAESGESWRERHGETVLAELRRQMGRRRPGDMKCEMNTVFERRDVAPYLRCRQSRRRSRQASGCYGCGRVPLVADFPRGAAPPRGTDASTGSECELLSGSASLSISSCSE